MTLATSSGSALRFCTVTWSPRLTSSGSSPRDSGVLTEPVAQREHEFTQDQPWIRTRCNTIHSNGRALFRRSPGKSYDSGFAGAVCRIAWRTKLAECAGG